MPVPLSIDDGDFRIAQANGAPDFNLPFSDKGDQTSYEMSQLYRQDYRFYRPMAAMTKVRTQLGDAYLVNESRTRSAGQGLLEFTRTFASVPVTRYEGTSINYAWQFYLENISFDYETPTTFQIGEIAATMNARTKFEYFLTQPPPIIAPRIAVLFGIYVYTFGGYGSLVPGMTIAAQDSQSRIYKGGIQVRETIELTLPPYIPR